MIETFDTYEEAAAVCDPDREMVCGTYLLDKVTAKYFVLDQECPDDVGRDTAFMIRQGRPPSQYEKWLIEIAQDLNTDERVDA